VRHTLAQTIDQLRRRWSLTIAEPFPHESAAWVAPVTRSDGSAAVLKIGMPHMEAEHEIAGLRFWEGNPTVRLLEAEESLHAMLLERCAPGSSLRDRPEPEQDEVIAGLLRRAWRVPGSSLGFRPLATMIDHWTRETLADSSRWQDRDLVNTGLAVFAELAAPSRNDVLLMTDLHAGNVLRAEREPWLAIDPKPFVGDPAYDATQHLLNCRDRVMRDPVATMARFAELLMVDEERVRLWLFARAAGEPREDWSDFALARVLATL
jgi:streptomycin 6-kinase